MIDFQKIVNIASIIIFLTTSSFFAIFTFISIKEQERRAAARSLYFFFFSFLLLIFVVFSRNEITTIFSVLILLFTILSIIIYFLPIGEIKLNHEKPENQFDERDIPFSRIHLSPGSDEFKSYYKMRPENLTIDDRTRKLPGLLSPKAKFANHFCFSAAEASFDFIETFRSEVEQNTSQSTSKFSGKDISWKIKRLAKYYGAHSVGITKLEKYHIYSNIGRGTGKYGDPVALPHDYAIAFTVEMDHEMTRPGPKASIAMESAKEYVEAARIAMQLAIFIKKIGYSARAHIDSNYRVIAPLVARDAGLGEIGRMGLLMTPDFGPRVRIGVVTTDMPMLIDQYFPVVSIIDFCRICKKCAENCPSKSIPFDDRKEINGALRWQIDMDSCFQYWNVAGTDCGRCMAICPYSHPNNLIHNIVRKTIHNSGFARRAALKMDDLLYGRIQEEVNLPNWLK